MYWTQASASTDSIINQEVAQEQMCKLSELSVSISQMISSSSRTTSEQPINNNQLRIEAARVGFIINEKKTEVMTFNCYHKSWEPGKKEVQLNKILLKRVHDFKYLDFMMKPSTSKAAMDSHGPPSVAWREKYFDLNVKLRLFEASVQSMFLYLVSHSRPVAKYIP